MRGREIFPTEENFARVFGFALFAIMAYISAKNHGRFSQKTPRLAPPPYKSGEDFK